MNLNFTRSYAGSSNPHAKITDDMAHNVCILLSTTNLTIQQVAFKLRISKNIVQEIYKRKTWKHISHYYKFKDRRPAWLK